MAVGTATGQVLLYDIRSNKPFFVKDHMYGLPIKDVEFHHQQDLIFSMDSSVVKIWDKNNVGFTHRRFFFKFCVGNSCYDTKNSIVTAESASIIAIVQFNVIMLVLPDSSLKSRGFWQR
jgi:WD40 repeat protein